ncbi:MAG: patatin-like phospholipase family protein [Candidatus Omnitrophica bacterium]|nr:patatin-like phospholipase family protein [Candidatus Omnitrophota bacterium]
MGFFFKKRKIAIALGGGAARGFANIGVLKVLEREHIPIDLVIGSSMGALVGAVYSLGRPVSYLQEEAEKFSWREITDMTIPRVAMTKGEKLAKVVGKFTEGKSFDECRIPTAITATDIRTGQELLYTSGNLQKIVIASCSWPGFFPPVRIDGRLLADGGLRHSVPVKWAKDLGATFVIAVRVGFEPQNIAASNIFQLMIQSIQIMGEELDKYQSMRADVIVEPSLKGITQLDFHKAKEIIANGEKAAEKVIDIIKRKLALFI